MGGVIHAFECMAHGQFEARVKPGNVPKCPKGCSRGLVSLIFVKPPGFVSARTRKGDKLVREMAETQGLSDISTSPSRPGGTVAQRNAMRGPQGRQYPALMTGGRGQVGGFKIGADFLNNFPQQNPLTEIGLGHKYDKSEWEKDGKTGQTRHVGAKPANATIPLGSTGVSIERVREKS